MNHRIGSIAFFIVLVITLFSLWAAFALLVVNQYFYEELPGYTIGRLCIWELVALLVSALIANRMIRKWGNLQIQLLDNELKLVLNPRFGVYFLVYFILVVLIGIWQFWLFSLQF